MHLFISHSTKDGAGEALALVAALERAGHRCWIAPRDVKAGVPYPGQIVAAIEGSKGLVLLVTPGANESPDVLQEVQIASTARKTIAPVMLRATAPAADLRYYVGVRHQIAWGEAGSVVTALVATFGAGASAGAPARRPGLDPGSSRQGAPKPGSEFRDGEGLPLMVTIPAGKFIMGSPDSEKDRYDNEGPQREVRIGYPLAVGKFPVTVGEWRKFIAATKHDMGDSRWASPGFAQDDSHPVTCVNWNDANAYIAWLNKRLWTAGAPPASPAQAGGGAGGPYRLLSEAEWEYACRAGTTTRYSCGDQIASAQANFNNKKRGTTPVGAYAANRFGLHDMHGNVWEWLQDFWNPNYNGAPSDGSANTAGNCSDRVHRGGSGDNDPRILRSAVRFWNAPTLRYASMGFRVARTFF